MMTVSQSQFKTKMKEYFKQIEKTGEDLVVTDHHIPIVKISPIRKKKSVDEVFGDVRGKIKYHQDILLPETD